MPGPEDGAPQDGTTKDLKSWWSKFKTRKPKDPAPLGPAAPAVGAIFGVPLTTSIKYANVAISLMQEDGSSYTYGYIPIVVAKCGVFLKDRATEVEGIFRLAGSARRMNALQEKFNDQPGYGKNLDWEGYTVHDAANVLRRYLNQLPEPIVPLRLYEQFRSPLRQHQTQAVGNMEAKEADIGNFDYDTTIQTYRTLITQLPPLNRQLLLYILDMLAIFAAKSGINHMTAANLAVIFQPGMLHHPSHDKLPHEYRLSQDVVIFLIDQQDNFLLGMAGTAADEKTKQEVEAGPPAGQPGTPTRAAGVYRSISTNSRSTNSSRLADIRRNMSVSSRGSRTSQHNAPGTPGTPGASGVHRSNTVPSRRSPAVSQSRFSRPSESSGTTPGATPGVTPGASADAPPEMTPLTIPPEAAVSTTPVAAIGTTDTIARGPHPPEMRNDSITPSMEKGSAARDQSKERLLGGESPAVQPTNTRRGLANFLRPQMSDDGQGKQPNKLRKRRLPSGAQPSGHSSAASLSADPDHARSPLSSPLQEPLTSGDEGLRHVSGASSSRPFALTETAPTPRATTHPDAGILKGPGAPSPDGSGRIPSETATLKPTSEAAQMNQDLTESNAETTDASVGPEGDGEKKKEKRRWRFSVSAKRNQEERQQQREQLAAAQASTSRLAGASDADLSKAGTSVSSLHRRRGSTANTDKPSLADSASDSMARRSSRDVGSNEERSPTQESSEKGKGPIGWFKQKLAERKEKDDARDRAKSPRRSEQPARSTSNVNIDAAANGDFPNRQRSTDISEIIEESREEETSEQPSIVDRTTRSPPVAVTTGGAAVRESAAQNSTHASSVEYYMGDSDREKLATARDVQAYLTQQNEQEKVTAAATSAMNIPATAIEANKGTITADASNIAIDPAYQAGDASANGIEEIPTPKASEINHLTVISAAAKTAEPIPEAPKAVSEERNTTV